MTLRPVAFAAVLLLTGLVLASPPVLARGDHGGQRLDPAERERLRGDLRQRAYQDRHYGRADMPGGYGPRGYPPQPLPGYQGPPPGYGAPPSPGYGPGVPYGGAVYGGYGGNGFNGGYAGQTGQGPYGYGPMPGQGAPAPRLSPDERQQLRRQLRDARQARPD